MRSQLPILIAALLLAVGASPALAEDDGFVVWDQSIAAAISARLPEEGRCGSSPYALYGPGCHRQLNLGFDRPILVLSFLDRAALFVYKYHKLNYKQSLWDNTKLRLELDLKNVYQQEAQARIELRYRFSSALPRFSLLGGSDHVDLAEPSFYDN